MTGRVASIILRVALIFALAAFAAGCTKKSDTDAAASPTPTKFIEDVKELENVQVAGRDEVTIEVHVFSASYFELDPENPVEIYPPANSSFEFETNIFRITPGEDTPTVEVNFTIPPRTRPGTYAVPMAMRLFYTDRATGRKETDSKLFKVPVKVIQRTTAGSRQHTFPMDYKLE
ncbi:hypothetical protein KDL45_08725 [bacterium]|nr:hypothetical protein [bacterium]MCB9475594.1 hypothetical protein [Deltaproteobacteria bacterium]